MRGLILAILLLTGCGGGVPERAAVFRDVTVPIASSTRFDAGRFTGDWLRVAAFAPPYTAPGCAVLSLRMQEGRHVLYPCGVDRNPVAVAVELHGRLHPDEGAPLWVLWVDDDHRTAVVGTPDGSFGWILNRGPGIRRDRLTAAREVLDFNGYDLAQLKVLRR